jgi:hypothetical protein
MKNEFHMIFITKSWDAKFMINNIIVCHLQSWEWHAPKGLPQGIMVNFFIAMCCKRFENIVHVCYWVLHIKESHVEFWDKFKMNKIELTNTSKCTNHYKKVIYAIIIKLVHHKPHACKGHYDLNLGGIPTFLFTLYSIGPHGA